MDYRKVKYRAPIDFLIDTPIREYDVSKANISILLDSGVISEEFYLQLYNSPKRYREITVGKMQGRDPQVAAILRDGFTECRKLFIEGNQLTDEEILSINNDSITVIGSRPVTIQQVAPHVYFRLDGDYTSYFSIAAANQRFDYLYGFNKITGVEQFRTRGLGHAEPFHENYMLDFLKELFKCLQVEGVEAAMWLLNVFHRDYTSRVLDIGYYRRLDQTGMYDVGVHSDYAKFQAMLLGNITKSDIDISFNESVLRGFQAMFTSYYFQRRDRK